MKKVLPLLLVALMFMACGNQTDRKENAKAMDSSEPAFIETDVLDFLENKENLVDKTIRIKGMVAHVCAHGGARFFLMHPDTEERVKVNIGNNLPSLTPDVEGSDVAVIGVVKELRVDNAYLDNWQAEVEAGMQESEKKIHTGEEGHEDTEHLASHDLEQINQYRLMLTESGKEYLSFFSIDCTKIEEFK